VFLGATALAKGIGFGAGLSLAVIAATLIASRDATTARRLLWFPGWAIAVCVALAWPLSVIGRHPEALALWWTHGPGRLVPAADVGFATASWPSFVGSYLAFTLPWTPLVLLAVIREGFSLSRRPGHDPFLLCWAAVPVMLVSVSSTRNAHYLLSSLPPWSIAAALTLERAAGRLSNRGWSTDRLRGSAAVLLGGLALAWGLGFACLGPSLDQRGKGREWSFYERCSRALSSDARVYLLYDAPDRPDRWDREPYKTPFGPVPPDLAARLFYLARQVVVAYGIGDLSRELDVAVPSRIAIIARPRDLPALKTLGAVEILGHGPAARIDRQFSFARLHYGDSESDLALARARPFD
jgi:hypothetical protein